MPRVLEWSAGQVMYVTLTLLLWRSIALLWISSSFIRSMWPSSAANIDVNHRSTICFNMKGQAVLTAGLFDD